MVTTFTYKPSLVKIDTHISSYRGNRPTNKQIHRQDRLQYTAPQLARSVIILLFFVDGFESTIESDFTPTTV